MAIFKITPATSVFKNVSGGIKFHWARPTASSVWVAWHPDDIAQVTARLRCALDRRQCGKADVTTNTHDCRRVPRAQVAKHPCSHRAVPRLCPNLLSPHAWWPRIVCRLRAV
jgi:hypothetical protein